MEAYNMEEVRNCYNVTARQYSDAFGDELDGKPFDRNVLQRFVASVDRTKPVYEFAAGSCHIADYVYRQGLRTVIATDITPESLKYAGKKYPHVKTEYRNMLSTGLENDSVSGIICFYGIVHFTYAEIDLALKEWKRILIERGRALFCFHVGNDDSLRVEKFLEIENAKATWNFFNVDTVLGLMENNGIEYEEAVIRYPYKGHEHPSKRCYVQFTKKAGRDHET